LYLNYSQHLLKFSILDEDDYFFTKIIKKLIGSSGTSATACSQPD
jgi:hypothetical protein